MTINRRQLFAAAPPLLFLLAKGGGVMAAGSSMPTNYFGLLATQEDWSSLDNRRKADPDLDRLTTTLLDRARRDVNLPMLERKLEGLRLLGVSREFIRRSLQWAFAYRVTGESIYLNRVRQEMLNISSFSDWHPEHYLDVAEMTTGLAISYSWLFNDLTAEDRSMVRRAIVDKGIGQAQHGHSTFKSKNNWNQVCSGGMALGALAVQDDQPSLAADLLSAAKRSVHIGLDAYCPDGIYPEGPGYWDYGTSYSVLLIAALRTAKEADWGILEAPGFKRSAEFYAHAIGPSGKAFNFSDGGEGPGFPCAIVYLARELEQPALLASMRQMIRAKPGISDRFSPLSALWWPIETAGKLSSTAFSGQGDQPVAIWRSSWSDTNALWFAIKAGGAAHNHAHMDAGSFVLDLDGVRWAKDLGMQDYNSLESRGIDLWNMKQNSTRWQVFRLSAQAHNTLTLNGQPHNATGMASLQMVDEWEALIDLTPAMIPGTVRQATRRVRFMDDAMLIRDEILGAQAETSIRWAMNTEAEAHIDGNLVSLTQKGKRLAIQFDGIGMQLDVLDISAPRRGYDVPNPNVRQLTVTGKPTADGSWRLTTRFFRG